MKFIDIESRDIGNSSIESADNTGDSEVSELDFGDGRSLYTISMGQLYGITMFGLYTIGEGYSPSYGDSVVIE